MINGTRLTGTEMWVKNSHLFISTCCRAVLFYSFHRFCAIVGLTVASISKAGRQSECQRVSHRGSSHTRRESEKHCKALGRTECVKKFGTRVFNDATCQFQSEMPLDLLLRLPSSTRRHSFVFLWSKNTTALSPNGTDIFRQFRLQSLF